MADRRVLVIDNDPTFLDALKSSLGPYGVDVDVVDDGSDGMTQAKQLSPELVLIGVELPEKVGYGVFRMAKKVLPKTVPVILATSSVTPADFEQHQKLKVHADDYLDKRTLTVDELLQKIDRCIGLGPLESPPEELELPVDAEEFSLEDDEISLIEEAPAPEEPAPAAEFSAEDATRISSELVDEGIDAETEAAFAAMGMGEAGLGDAYEVDDSASTDLRNAPPPEVVTAAPEEVVEPEIISDEALIPEMDAQLDEGAAPETMDADQDVAAVAADLDLGLDAVAEQAGEEGSGLRPHPSAALIADLEAENLRLAKELEDLRKSGAGATASTFSREREFLNLREVINRKEKDVLDLKDEVGGKDRLILGGKEKVRELERKARETDERLLAIEGSLVTANETIAGLSRDKDKGLERERGLKARIETAQGEIKKAHEEVEAHKRKVESGLRAADENLARAKREQEAERAKAEQKAASAEQTHAAALRDAQGEHGRALAEKEATLHKAHAQAIAKLERDFETARSEATAAHESALATLKQLSEDAVAQKEEELQGELARAAQEREDALAAAEEARSADLAKADATRTRELGEKESEHKKAQAALAERSQAELGRHKEATDKALAERDAQHTEALQQADERHGQEVAALQSGFDAEKAEVEEQARTALAALREEVTGLEAALSSARERIRSLEAELATSSATVLARDGTIESYLRDIAEYDIKLIGLKRQVEDLEQQSAGHQDQLLKAYKKIKSDEATVEKAKKAVAVALTLLDSNGAHS
jgi:CheY-like chemotaxis protein